MTRPIGWDPDPLDALPPEPDRRESRRWGCSVAVLVLILALSGVPGVVASRSGSQPGVTSACQSSCSVEFDRQPVTVSDAETLNTVPPLANGSVGTVLLGGFATWYDTPGFTAAAGPALRDVLGDWRGRYVTVEAGDRSVIVRLTDWCACGERHGRPTLLDLSRKAFTALADPARGVVRVSIEIDGSPRPDEADDRMRDEVRDIALPQTDAL